MPVPSGGAGGVTGGASGEARDVVTLAVMTNRMEGVARKMTNTLFRTARSTVLNTARDFSCCIVTANHEMLVMAESLPIHVISGPDTISRRLREWHPRPRRGDAFIHNSPYHGNSHAGDHCIVVPVIDDEGKQRATAVVKAHMADIGNSEPTTLMATARDVYEEGALIFPCVKIQEGYADIDDVVRMCTSRIRVPEDWCTEGAGRFRGAPSLYIEYGPVDTELEVLYAADGTVNPALGVRGGQSGALCRPAMRKAGGELVELDAWARVVLAPGETIVSISSGGGGYGPAHERDVERVLGDLREGWVGAERAREVYGVVLGDDGSLDEGATRSRRSELAATALDSPAAGDEAAAAARAVHGREGDPVELLVQPGRVLWPAGAPAKRA
jgi:N-methylhydantoinase B/oxoprolinase/acetone carboxylase alpha subunit